MNGQQCSMTQLDALIVKNRSIEQSEYVMAKRYNDSLLDIENSIVAISTLKEESDDVKLKLSLASKSVEKLKREIQKLDADVKQVNKDIERYAVKDDAIKNEMMYQICTPTHNDQQTIFEKMVNADLWNMFKYSNEVSLQEGGGSDYNPSLVDAWKQFRLESTN